MNTKESVESYLIDLKNKINFWNIFFEDREEFFELQKELEMKQSDCKQIVLSLIYKDYCQGPIKDTINDGEYWVFGKVINGYTIYIKININKPRKPVICISFHKAKYKMTYPLINK